MNVNTQIRYNNGNLEIVTKKEYQFSEVEKKILNVLALNGSYEIEQWEFLDNPDESQRKQDAIENLLKLGLIEVAEDSPDYEFNVVKSDEVMAFFRQIIKEGV